MSIETIAAGRWLFSEGGVPEYFLYKLLKGRVSDHKGGVKLRDVKVEEGDPPLPLGVAALLSDHRVHMSSVRAETDVVLDKTSVDQIRGILAAEIPAQVKHEIDVMRRSIVLGNEVVSKWNEFSGLPTVDLEIAEGMRPEVREVVSEIKRLYELVRDDLKRLAGT